jgi:hypothetical protein
VDNTATAATFAGQNGRTYSSVGTPKPVQQQGSILPLVLAGAVALFALS